MTLQELRTSQPSTGRHEQRPLPDDRATRLPYSAVIASDEVGRHKLETILRQAAFPIVASTQSVEELLDTCKGGRLDVVVLWGGQASASWQPDVRHLVAEIKTLKVVVAAGADGGRSVRRALRAGAAGFVPKSDVDSCLLATVYAAVAGQVCVPCGARVQLARPAFSHREKRILQLIALGHTNNEIAGQLFLAESTVKTHVSACFRKLGVVSRAEAAAVVLDPQSAIELGIVPSPVIDHDKAPAATAYGTP
jgi:DNA-binding NarL/FixJ family response regulator